MRSRSRQGWSWPSGSLSPEGYATFCDAYGDDVTTWAGFELLRDVRELRNACWMAQQAAIHTHVQHEAERRVASLRGHRGPRPWGWQVLL
jgi:hypothetical protein